MPGSIRKEIVKAAEEGDARAQFELGWRYKHGRGVPKDVAEAEKWWRKAAENGNTNAQYSLGFDCARVIGVDEAIKWIKEAADRGHSQAQIYLGWMYYCGLVMPRDTTLALMWVILGTRNRYAIIPRLFGTLIRVSIHSDRISEAERRAREWEARY